MSSKFVKVLYEKLVTINEKNNKNRASVVTDFLLGIHRYVRFSASYVSLLF